MAATTLRIRRETSTAMGRIIARVKVGNFTNPQQSITLDALVDTGASHLILPSAWKDRLGELPAAEKIDAEVADQTVVPAEICGPVKVQIEGFRATATEVVFIDMESQNGVYEPLLGYIVLEQSLAAVDMVNHRLVHVKHIDAK